MCQDRFEKCSLKQCRQSKLRVSEGAIKKTAQDEKWIHFTSVLTGGKERQIGALGFPRRSHEAHLATPWYGLLGKGTQPTKTGRAGLETQKRTEEPLCATLPGVSFWSNQVGRVRQTETKIVFAKKALIGGNRGPIKNEDSQP